MEKLIQQEISNKINLLPVYHQLAFGIMLSERFLPNYFAFHFVERRGNPMILLNGIDLLKTIVRQESYDSVELQLIDNLIEDVTPDMDDFPGNVLASFALDVSSMLYECFSFVKDNKSKHLELCSRISMNSLEMFVQNRDSLKFDLTLTELNEYFKKDVLIGTEIEYQMSLLNELLSDAKINNKLYIEKTLKAPNIALDAVRFTRRAG